MEFTRKALCVLFSILIGASLLSGANVMFDEWYKLPEKLSVFILMLITFVSLVQLSLKITARYRRSTNK